MKSYLVSIIIPTYNRAHLIGETLDSVIAQTYQNWECIVVDDGSTDYTDELLEFYCTKDHRIQYHNRPNNRRKGANACRNYGFELSEGEYVKWFDSDDLMSVEHLEKVLSVFSLKKVHFVITDCQNFEFGKETKRKPFDLDKSNLQFNALNFAKYKIGWITNDFTGKRESLRGIKFNERLKGGQEYNFFVKFLVKNQNGYFIDEVLTLARLHKNSLTKENRNIKNTIIAELKILTLIDVYPFQKKKINKWLFSGYVHECYQIGLNRTTPPFLLWGILYSFKVQGIFKGLGFILGFVMVYFFKTGYNLFRYART